jgi:hypothetical protein
LSVNAAHAGSRFSQFANLRIITSHVAKIQRLQLAEQSRFAANIQQALFTQIATTEFASRQRVAGKDIAIRRGCGVSFP